VPNQSLLILDEEVASGAWLRLGSRLVVHRDPPRPLIPRVGARLML
jgi:hypothetical protein